MQRSRKRLLVLDEESPAKRFRLDNNVPTFRGYELLGDSQLMRFSVKLLNHSVRFEASGIRRIGCCVSGQTIHDLFGLLKGEDVEISKKVILLIGTNDVTKSTDVEDFEKTTDSLLELLKNRCEKIVLVSIPPVPRFRHQRTKTTTLQIFNNFLREHVDNEQVYMVDLFGALHDENRQIRTEYYEKFIGRWREDLIHLNKQGFELLKSILDEEYFLKYTET